MRTLIQTFQLSALSILLLTGCTTPFNAPQSTAQNLPPNFDTPDSEFVPARFNTLASEFIDEYAGQYIVVKGRFVMTAEGALVWASGRPYNLNEMMSAMIASSESDTTRNITVMWSQYDRELGRPFLDLPMNAPVKVYGYVLPAGHNASVKSRSDIKMRGLPVPVILLIKISAIDSP